MYGGWLIFARDNDRSSAMRAKILGDRRDPFLLVGGPGTACLGGARGRHACRPRQGACKGLDF